MISKKRTGWVFAVSLNCLLSFTCFADEILFQNQQGLQSGFVVREDNQSVVIRFPREAIKSITRSEEKSSAPSSGNVLWEEKKDYLILKIPRSSIQVIPQQTPAGTPAMKPEPALPGLSQKSSEKDTMYEKQSKNIEKSGTAKIPGPQTSMNIQQKMLQEEMGRVEGVIMWKEKPLQNSKVKIVLESYTGFSVAALKKEFAKDKGNFSQDEITLETTTDSQGHYAFHEAPPGYYRLYWMPDKTTVWIHRLREKPDLEVIAGNLTTVDIPGNRK